MPGWEHLSRRAVAGQSGPPLRLHPQPQGVTVQPGMCAKWLFGPWGTRWTRWPVKAASGPTSPGPHLSSHFLPCSPYLSWEQRWGWRGCRDGETEARQRPLLVLAAPSFPVDLYLLLIKAVESEPGAVSKVPGPRVRPYGPCFISSLPLPVCGLSISSLK